MKDKNNSLEAKAHFKVRDVPTLECLWRNLAAVWWSPCV